MKKTALLITITALVLISAQGSEELGLPEGPLEAPVAGPALQVYGNGFKIGNGDTHPDDYDLTDFETVWVGEREDHYFSIHNSGDTTLVLDGPLYVSIAGDDKTEFRVIQFPNSELAPDEWSTFAIRFDPDSAGEKEAIVSIYSNDSSDNPYSFVIEGYASGSWVSGACGSAASSAAAATFWLPILLLMGVVLVRRVHSKA